MNGATLFGVGLTILAISFELEFVGWKALLFGIIGYLYFATSIVAFLFQKLS